LVRIDRSADEKGAMPPIFADGCVAEPVEAVQNDQPNAVIELNQSRLFPIPSFTAPVSYILDVGQYGRFLEHLELVRHQDTDLSCLMPPGVNMIEFSHW
jgi:hypothetical protein